MATAFNRKYELIIGKPQVLLINKSSTVFRTEQAIFSDPLDVNELIQIAIDGDNGQDYFTVDPAKQITITDLQITAKLLGDKSSNSSSTKTSHIKVINPSTETQDFISAKDNILLRAGYASEETLPLLYVGQVESVSVEKVGEDTEMLITLGDASNVRNDVVISHKWERGTTYDKIISDMVSVFNRNGVPTGKIIQTVNSGKTIKNGVSAEGLVSKKLEEVCESIGHRYYQSLGKIYIEPILTDRQSRVPTVSVNEDQVKGGIRVKKQTKDDKSNPDDGITVKTFLNARIQLALDLRVEYGRYKGDYTISSVEHELDYRGDQWDTIVECQGKV